VKRVSGVHASPTSLIIVSRVSPFHPSIWLTPHRRWMAPNVLLLRGTLHPDPYHHELVSLEYNPRSIPPLDTTFVHQDELRHRMSETPSVRAVILTSARSADAWRDALVALYDANVDASVLRSWEALPFYVVGSATATALTAPDAARPNLPLPVDIRGAAETGTSTRLAEFIVEDLAGVHCEMLYLVGDKNSDALPEIVKKAGIQLQVLQVYATCGSPTFADDLRSLVEEVGTLGVHILYDIITSSKVVI
jgi:uroporphyrinogen-III synthase